MQLSRRFFLKSSGALAASCGLAPVAPLSFALASSEVPRTRTKAKKTLVALFLRGGFDGLSLVVPYTEPRYYTLRRWVGVRRPGEEGGALDLDGTFGLHPFAKSLVPLFESGLATCVHAVGHSSNTRSHFEEQDFWETGLLGSTVHTDGWLNRHLALTEGGGPVRAVSIGESLPRILRGRAESVAVRGLSDLSLGARGDTGKTLDALARAYGSKEGGDARGLLQQSAQSTVAALRELQKVAQAPYESKVEYPNTGLGKRLREVARLIRADVGLEVCEVDFGGWDTHQNQGAIGGPYSQLVRELSDAVAAFCGDLEDRLDDVLLVTLSEFGRTAAQNGTGGTDHGWANPLFAIGGAVAAKSGGKRPTIGRWPGLGEDELHQGRDVQHTTDFRDVLAEIAGVHLGTTELGTLFPGHERRAVGLV